MERKKDEEGNFSLWVKIGEKRIERERGGRERSRVSLMGI